MELLSPLWLALGAAASVPLLLHLLRRRIGTRVDFPAARYLARAEQEASARLRLRNLLLMALRVLAVLLVALAAARPLADLPGASRGPAAVAVVLDNSLSTTAVVDGRPVLDRLREAARLVLAEARADDRVWLVTADGAVTGGTAEALRGALDRVTPWPGRGDLPAAVARAVGLVAGGGTAASGRGVVVVTDGQATAWPRGVATGDVPLVVVRPPGGPPATRGIVGADAVPGRWSPGGEVVARVTGAESTVVRVDLRDAAGRPVGTGRGSVGPGGIARIPFRPAARGWLAGTVALPPDEWRGDDERHVAVFVGDAPALLADASAGAFAATAVASLAAAGRARVAGGEGTVTVVEAGSAVRRPAVLIAPASGAGVGPANRALERLGVPWRFGPLVTTPARARLAPLSEGDSAVTVDVARRWRLVPQGAAVSDTLAAVGAEPWAVGGPGYVLLASPLDPAWTAFPVRAAFVPWLGGVATRRLQPAGEVRRAAPGAPVVPPAGAEGLRGPTGAVTRLAGAGPLSVPAAPGVYLWLRGDAHVGALVVDPDVEELQLARLNDGALGARVRGGAAGGGRGAVTVVADGGAAAARAFGAGGRRPIGGALAAAALVALALEGLLTRQRRRPGVAGAPVARAA